MIRPAGPQDVRFLRDMLRHAYFWRMNESAELPVARYVTGWGREGDSGFVAIDELQPVGAAWYRLFPPREAGFGFVDERTPELTVAVVPSRRGKGIGHELLEALLAQARSEGYDALSLSSPSDSTGLYERYGFRVVSDEGDALTMQVSLQAT